MSIEAQCACGQLITASQKRRPTMTEEDSTIAKILNWALDVDPVVIAAFVKAERERKPGRSDRKFAEDAFSQAIWKATVAGAMTGLPANIWVSIPAALTDASYVLRAEIIAASRAAVFFDENFFSDETARWELLIPIFGVDATSQIFREFGIKGGMGLTRAAIKKFLSKEILETFKKVMWKYFAIKVTQKGIITKTLPIVGGIIGGTWNNIEVRAVRNRTIRYFEARE
jgi:hypothetical protein